MNAPALKAVETKPAAARLADHVERIKALGHESAELHARYSSLDAVRRDHEAAVERVKQAKTEGDASRAAALAAGRPVALSQTSAQQHADTALAQATRRADELGGLTAVSQAVEYLGTQLQQLQADVQRRREELPRYQHAVLIERLGAEAPAFAAEVAAIRRRLARIASLGTAANRIGATIAGTGQVMFALDADIGSPNVPAFADIPQVCNMRAVALEEATRILAELGA